MRAFFAISVPIDIAKRLHALVPPLKSLRRARVENLHLTLHFLTEAPATLAADFGSVPLPGAFTLSPGRLILLPESGPVRVIAASLAPPLQGLRDLHAAIGGELSRLGMAPAADGRGFLPHLTLARSEPPLPQQVRSQTPMVPREDLSFRVNHFELIESRPCAEGGFEYHTLRTWQLS